MTRGLRARLAAGIMGALAVAGVAAGGLAVQQGTAHALTNCTVADNAVALDAEEAAFLALINNYRAQNGRGALTTSTNLNRAATWSAADMGAKRYFSHTDSAGRSPSQRAMDCGYPSGAGENIAAGTVWDTAQEAFTAWRNSAGHNANMLNASYRQIGIARAYTAGSPYGWYWVTSFGLVNDGTGGGTGGGTATPPPTQTPPPTPTPPPAIAQASLTSPAPGSTLPGASVTFGWTSGAGAQEYFFYAGTAAGANNLYGNSTGLNRSVTVSNLPMNGSTVYVRLWTRFAPGWQFTDYTYRAATAGGGGGEVAAKASLTSPPPGAVLRGGAATFA